MKSKYIKALADVLDIDMHTLDGMTSEEKLQRLEALQLQAILDL